MEQSSISNVVRDILVKLNFLAQLKQGHKPCVQDLSIVDGRTYYGIFVRTFKRENKHMVVSFVKDTVTQANRLVEDISLSSYLPLLISTMANAKVGVESLIYTYQEYPGIKSELQVCWEDLKLKLEKYKDYLINAQKNNSNSSVTPTVVAAPTNSSKAYTSTY